MTSPFFCIPRWGSAGGWRYMNSPDQRWGPSECSACSPLGHGAAAGLCSSPPLLISKLLWLSSGNGSGSFLHQLSDLYLASLQKHSLSSQLVWNGRFWIRSLPLMGLMFRVLSHGFTESWGRGGAPLGCTGAMINYNTSYSRGVTLVTKNEWRLTLFTSACSSSDEFNRRSS